MLAAGRRRRARRLCRRAAVAGLTSTALSQVSRVIGLGSSCSQPLLAKRPSRTDGSWRNDDLDARRRPGVAIARTADCETTRHRLGAEGGVRHDAVVQPAPPRRVVLVDLPVLADDVVGRALGPIGQRRQHFVRRLAAVERRDQRLHDRRGAVEAARVAPRLEEMRLGNLPVAALRRLVVVEAEVRAQRDLVQRRRERRGRPAPCRPDCRRGSAGRSTVPAFMSATSVAQRLELVDRLGFDRSACRRPSCPRCRVPALIACASAWTAAGCWSPAIDEAATAMRAAGPSRRAAIHFCAGGAEARMPRRRCRATAAASARAARSIWLGLSGRR